MHAKKYKGMWAQGNAKRKILISVSELEWVGLP